MGKRPGRSLRKPGRRPAHRRLLHLTGRSDQRPGGAETKQNGLRGDRTRRWFRRLERRPRGGADRGAGRRFLANRDINSVTRAYREVGGKLDRGKIPRWALRVGRPQTCVAHHVSPTKRICMGILSQSGVGVGRRVPLRPTLPTHFSNRSSHARRRQHPLRQRKGTYHSREHRCRRRVDRTSALRRRSLRQGLVRQSGGRLPRTYRREAFISVRECSAPLVRTRLSRVISETDRQPARPIVRSKSAIKLRRTSRTPSSPPSARP